MNKFNISYLLILSTMSTGLLQAAVQPVPKRFGGGYSQLTQRPSQTTYQDWQLAFNRTKIALENFKKMIITSNEIEGGRVKTGSKLDAAITELQTALADLGAKSQAIEPSYPNVINKLKELESWGLEALHGVAKKIQAFRGGDLSEVESIADIRQRFQALGAE